MCESTSSQPPLKHFRLLAQDMMEHSSAAAVTVSNTVDRELIAYFADWKTYSENNGLTFWVMNANKYPLLAPLAQNLLSAPASEAYVERVLSVCGELTAGKRNRPTKSLKRIMLKMNLKYYAWFSMILFSRLLGNISGSSAR